jgi:hypothetical protein
VILVVSKIHAEIQKFEQKKKEKIWVDEGFELKDVVEVPREEVLSFRRRCCCLNPSNSLKAS